MNCDNTVLCAKIMKNPTTISIRIIGVNHHTFLTLRNCHASPISPLFFDIFYIITKCMSCQLLA